MKYSLLAWALLLSGCRPGGNSKQAHLFNIDSLLNRQVVELARLGAVVQKTASVNGDLPGTSSLIPDSAGWARELELFREIQAINKPVVRNAYEVSVRRDLNSNLQIKTFVATRPVALHSLSLYYLDSPSYLKKIEAVVKEEDALQKTGRQMTLHFDRYHDVSLLTGYSLSAHQKMILADPVSIFLLGAIRWPD